MIAGPTTRRWRSRVAAVALVGGLVAAGAAAGSAAAVERAPSRPATRVASCRPVRPGGAAPRTAGAATSHATVVVDTGDGVVWAACIAFTGGAISGRDALTLADGPIPGLNPTFDSYGSLGAAVCELRGVGRPPPNCLSGGADYWGYWRNGRYSGAGAGTTQVRDGDTEAWRWGQGERPAAPTDGSVCTAAPPPTSPPATSGPGPGNGGGLQAHIPGGGVSAAPRTVPGTAPAGGASPSTIPRAGPPTTSAPTTRAASPSTVPVSIAVRPVGSGRASGLAAGAASRASGASTGGARRTAADQAARSPVPSVVGFGAALALVVGLVLLARRRRRPATNPGG